VFIRYRGKMFRDLLPSNERPSVVNSVTFGNVFTEPLPSRGHIRHSINVIVICKHNVLLFVRKMRKESYLPEIQVISLDQQNLFE
jgi:hypothetical protein